MEAHQINALRQYLKDTAGERHPLKEHILADQGDYHKNFYMKSLCMMATLDGALGDEQVFLLQRLIAGAHCSYGIEEYIRQGRDMEDGDIRELMEEILQGDLAYSFLFDLMILHHIAPIQSQTATFLGEIAEGLRLKTDAVTFMAEVCNALLVGQKKASSTKAPEEMAIKVVKPYLLLCGVSMQCITNKDYYIWYPKLTKHNCIAKEMQGKSVYLYNVQSDTKLCFVDCAKVLLVQCCFKNFDSHVLSFEGTNNLETACTIVGSIFEDCYRRYTSSGWIVESQLFECHYHRKTYIYHKIHLDLYDTKFIRCGGRNTEGYIRATIIGGEHAVVVKNCTFEDCWHYSSNQKNSGEYCTLFAQEVKNINNTVINSTKFN